MTPNLVPLILKYWHKKDDDNHSDLDDKEGYFLLGKSDKGDYFLISGKKHCASLVHSENGRSQNKQRQVVGISGVMTSPLH